jgi:hypothetical protein
VHEIGYGVDVLTLKKLLAVALKGVAIFLLAHEFSSARSLFANTNPFQREPC